MNVRPVWAENCVEVDLPNLFVFFSRIIFLKDTPVTGIKISELKFYFVKYYSAVCLFVCLFLHWLWFSCSDGVFRTLLSWGNDQFRFVSSAFTAFVTKKILLKNRMVTKAHLSECVSWTMLMLLGAEKFGSFFRIDLQRGYNESIYLILKFLFRYVIKSVTWLFQIIQFLEEHIMMREITEVILILTVISDFDSFGWL